MPFEAWVLEEPLGRTCLITDSHGQFVSSSHWFSEPLIEAPLLRVPCNHSIVIPQSLLSTASSPFEQSMASVIALVSRSYFRIYSKAMIIGLFFIGLWDILQFLFQLLRQNQIEPSVILALRDFSFFSAFLLLAKNSLCFSVHRTVKSYDPV